MIRVLQLCSALYIGGAERVIADLLTNVDRDRFWMAAAHLIGRGAIGDELIARGEQVLAVPRRHGRVGRYLSFLGLAQLLQELQIDLVHTHTTYALNDAVLCKRLLRRDLKVVHTFHFGNYPDYPWRYRVLERVGTRLADRLVAVGHEQRRRICQTYGLDEDRVPVIGNGIARIDAHPDPQWQSRLRAGGDVVIGSVCTFIEQKGLPDFLAVAQRLCQQFSNLQFVLAGDGPLRSELQRRCVELGIADRVHFPGWRADARTAILPLFDVFLQTSRWEAMSIAILEAMSQAIPVVATDVGDNKRVVQHGKTGFVARPGDTEGLTSAVSALIAAPDLRKSMGSAGHARFCAGYTASTMVASYEALYRECMTEDR